MEVEQDGANEDVDWLDNGQLCRPKLGGNEDEAHTDTTAEEGKQERGIARHLGGDLELEEGDRWRGIVLARTT